MTATYQVFIDGTTRTDNALQVTVHFFIWMDIESTFWAAENKTTQAGIQSHNLQIGYPVHDLFTDISYKPTTSSSLFQMTEKQEKSIFTFDWIRRY